MCGIAGYIEFSKNKIVNGRPYGLLNEMLNSISYRGPDDFGMSIYGYEINENIEFPSKVVLDSQSDCHVALGHRRLSIIDLSENGRQPMRNKDNSLEVTFNGEIYNYIELRQELSSFRQFYTQTDTEVLVACYEKWGVEMFSKIDGMFSFALFDKKNKKVVFARDMAGVKPLYYNYSDRGIIFGSEPKTVLTGLATKGSIDRVRTSEFLIMGVTDHDEGTFYSEVNQLPGGCYMEVDISGAMNPPVRYWSPSNVVFTEIKDYSIEMLEKLNVSVTRQLRADVKLGTSLSGGIDSGTIVCMAGEILGKESVNYNTLTFSFPDFPGDESELAKLTADNAGMRWNRITPSLDTISSDLENMIKIMGEPFSTLSMFAQYKIMQAAGSMGIKVMLDGQGGDEVYLGYPRVAQRILRDYLKNFKFSSFFREWIGLKKHSSMPLIKTLMSNVFFSSPWVAVNRNKSRLNPYVNENLIDSYRKEVAEEVYSSGDIISTQANEFTRFCLPRLLRYTDRNSMAFSVESRVPHLSKVMLDFGFKLPLDWRIRNGWTKYSIRKAMAGKLSKEILWTTQKQGFPVPQKFWVEKIRKDIERILKESDNVKKIINTDKVLTAIDNGLGSEPFLWRIISVGMWMSIMDVEA